MKRVIRDETYGLHLPISTKPLLFHILTMDFIVVLPSSHIIKLSRITARCNVDCKFGEAFAIFARQNKLQCSIFGNGLLARGFSGIRFTFCSNFRLRCEILEQFLEKFVSQVNTEILISTTYHPQTDDQSGRSNQCFYLGERCLIIWAIVWLTICVNRIIKILAIATVAAQVIYGTEFLNFMQIHDNIYCLCCRDF